LIVTTCPEAEKLFSSKYTLSAEVGLDAPGLPPLVADQWFVLSLQLPVPPTQYLFAIVYHLPSVGKFLPEPHTINVLCLRYLGEGFLLDHRDNASREFTFYAPDAIAIVIVIEQDFGSRSIVESTVPIRGIGYTDRIA